MSTGSDSDRVTISAISILAISSDPVATAPGPDSTARGKLLSLARESLLSRALALKKKTERTTYAAVLGANEIISVQDLLARYSSVPHSESKSVQTQLPPKRSGCEDG